MAQEISQLMEAATRVCDAWKRKQEEAVQLEIDIQRLVVKRDVAKTDARKLEDELQKTFEQGRTIKQGHRESSPPIQVQDRTNGYSPKSQTASAFPRETQIERTRSPDLLPSAPADYEKLNEQYPTIINDKGVCTEIRCLHCGANMTQKNATFLSGINGMKGHLRGSHNINISDKECLDHCIRRIVSRRDVQLMKSSPPLAPQDAAIDQCHGKKYCNRGKCSMHRHQSQQDRESSMDIGRSPARNWSAPGRASNVSGFRASFHHTMNMGQEAMVENRHEDASSRAAAGKSLREPAPRGSELAGTNSGKPITIRSTESLTSGEGLSSEQTLEERASRDYGDYDQELRSLFQQFARPKPKHGSSQRGTAVETIDNVSNEDNVSLYQDEDESSGDETVSTKRGWKASTNRLWPPDTAHKRRKTSKGSVRSVKL